MKLFYMKPCDKLKLRRAKRVNRYEGYWEQTALPLGNGNLGLSVLDETEKETVVVNLKTLWTGGPSPSRPDYAGGNLIGKDDDGRTVYDYFKSVRELFSKRKDSEAAAMCDKLVGIEEGYGSYQCYGEIVFRTDGEYRRKEYARSLDLEDATYRVCRGGGLKKEYFVSIPDKVAVMKMTKDDGTLVLDVSFLSRHGARQRVTEKGIFHDGELLDNGLRFSAALLYETDGRVAVNKDSVRIENANYAVFYLAGDTDYLDNYPVYRTGEASEELSSRVVSAALEAKEKGYAKLYERNVTDYRALYGRVSIDLGGTKSKYPTDAALKKYPKKSFPKEEKRALEALMYQYGRYLTIASSQESDLLPSNLQGIWNVSDHPAWNSDFHLNVNLQMNYWPTYSANLAECAKPLIRYIDKMRKPARLSAEIYTGIASEKDERNGFLFHTQNTPFGWTCPGWDFSWGWSPAAVAWILHNIYEKFEYGQDKEELKNDIYPMLKESADYFSKLLVEGEDGRLVTSPCFSPEHGPRTIGNTYEQSLVWQLLKDAADAADALSVDREKSERWNATRARLKPIEIGADGQIKEWYFETKLGKIGQKKHRHLSHLLGLYPLNVIDKFQNPSEAKAAVVSLIDRGDVSVGWAMAQRLNSWARAGDGNHAHALIRSFFKNSVHFNLFDVHPPFQIDGNFGYTAGINEMLLQSNLGRIELLPALPDAWGSGEVKGLIARGNFEVSISFLSGRLIKADILSRAGGTARIYCRSIALKTDAQSETERDGTLVVALARGETVTVYPVE